VEWNLIIKEESDCSGQRSFDNDDSDNVDVDGTDPSPVGRGWNSVQQ